MYLCDFYTFSIIVTLKTLDLDYHFDVKYFNIVCRFRKHKYSINEYLKYFSKTLQQQRSKYENMLNGIQLAVFVTKHQVADEKG